MKTGIGYANIKNPFDSGITVSNLALKNGNISNPDLVMAFCNSSLDHSEFYRGLRSVIGDKTPIIGGSAIGILTNNQLSYEGSPSGALILESDDVRFAVDYAVGLDLSVRNTGITLAKKFSRTSEDRLFLLFYDSIRQPSSSLSPPVINSSAPLIAAVEEVLGNDLSIVGGGLLGDNDFSWTEQFTGSSVNRHSATGCLISGNCTVYTRIMHGCTPLDGTYHTITKMDGDIIYELDNIPIVKIIDDIYGHSDWRHEHPLNLLGIGVNYGDRYNRPAEAHYVNRLITGALPDASGIRLFEADLEEGIDIQFMLRDTGEMIESAFRNSNELLNQIHSEGKTPMFGMYIDCGGRNASISNTITEEAAEVQKEFNNAGIPLFGFYSGVEIAPLLGKSRGLDYTGVLLVLAGR